MFVAAARAIDDPTPPASSQPAQRSSGFRPPGGASQSRGTVVLKPGETPGIRFAQPIYSFERVMAPTPVEHEFEFENTGNGPLEILAVRPDCGCTTAAQFERVIPPGGKGKIPIKIETERLRGQISKSIDVTTNAPPPNSIVTLRLEGEVWHAIELTPPAANFGRVGQIELARAPRDLPLSVVNNLDRPMSPSKVRSNSPAFSGRIREVERGKRFELVVSLHESEKTGSIAGQLEFDTGLSELPLVKLTATAFIVAPVDVRPNVILVNPNVQRDLVRTVNIVNDLEEPLEIRNVTASHPRVKVSVEETKPPGRHFRLTIVVPQGVDIPAEGEYVRFETSYDKMPVVKVPFVRYTPARPQATTMPAGQNKPTRMLPPRPITPRPSDER